MEITRRHTGIRISPSRRAFLIINTIVLILISAVMLYPAIYLLHILLHYIFQFSLFLLIYYSQNLLYNEIH